MKVFSAKSAVIVIIIIALGAGVFAARKALRPATPAYETVSVKRADVRQEVTVTGRVTPAESVNLAFEKGGRVALVPVVVGQTVRAGDILVALESAELQAQLLQQEASLDAARARLAEVKRGTRSEEITIAQVKVANAKKALADAEANSAAVARKATIDLSNLYSGVVDILRDAYAKADDAVIKQTDELFNNDISANPTLSFVTADAQARTDAESLRAAVTTVLKDFKADLDTIGSTAQELDTVLIRASGRLSIILNLLDAVTSSLNTSTSLSATAVTSYKTNINTGRSNVTAALTSINNKTQAIAAQRVTNENALSTAAASVNDFQNALASAQAELSLKQAGALPEAIAVSEADVRQAEASVLNTRAQLEKMTLRSPLDGVVSALEAKVGEVASVNGTIVSLFAIAAFQIEANVPEVDIAKIAIGNTARVTLDAYGSDVPFEARVTAIDPAETIIDGVATYMVTLQFSTSDERIKSGMTANLDIIGETRISVLTLPQRMVTRSNGEELVTVLRNGAAAEVVITTGLRGVDGSVEIVSGLTEGEVIIIPQSGR